MNCITIPDNTLFTTDIAHYVNILNISNYKGTYMRDELPSGSPKYKECGILNFNIHSQQGSHWTAWYKHGKK